MFLLASTIYLLTITVGLVLSSPYHFVLGTNGSSSTYNFGYDTHDQSGDDQGPRLMREETRLADGTVVGRYGYTDPFGVFRQVKYVAGPNGYYAYEDVGGRGSTSLPLFFKATARQRDLGIFAPGQKSSIDLSAKFNPPLYHPEAHLAEVPPSSQPSSSSSSSSSAAAKPSWDFIPHHHQHQAPSHSINNKLSPSPSLSSPRQSRVVSPPLDDDQGLFSSSSSSSWSSSEAGDGSFPPKTAFHFDYDQESLIRKKVSRQEEDLKELESFRLPSNVNVYRSGNKAESVQRLPRRPQVTATVKPSIGPVSTQSTLSRLDSTETANGTHHEGDFPGERSSTEGHDYSASVSITSVAMETSSAEKADSGEAIPAESKNSMNLENVSNYKSIHDGGSASESLRSSNGKEDWNKMQSNGNSQSLRAEDIARFRAATIPEVEIMSTYGTRLNHRIDDQPESLGYYEPRVLRGLSYDELSLEPGPYPIYTPVIESRPSFSKKDSNNEPVGTTAASRESNDETTIKSTSTLSSSTNSPNEAENSPDSGSTESSLSSPNMTVNSSSYSLLTDQALKIENDDNITLPIGEGSGDIVSTTIATVVTTSTTTIGTTATEPSEILMVREDLTTLSTEGSADLETGSDGGSNESTTEFESSREDVSTMSSGQDSSRDGSEPVENKVIPVTESTVETTSIGTLTSELSDQGFEPERTLASESTTIGINQGLNQTVPVENIPSTMEPITIRESIVPKVTAIPSSANKTLESREFESTRIEPTSDGNSLRETKNELVLSEGSANNYLPDKEQEEWLRKILRKVNSSKVEPHRIESRLETPDDLNKPRKRIIKIWYKRGRVFYSGTPTLSQEQLPRAKIIRIPRNHRHQDQFNGNGLNFGTKVQTTSPPPLAVSLFTTESKLSTKTITASPTTTTEPTTTTTATTTPQPTTTTTTTTTTTPLSTAAPTTVTTTSATSISPRPLELEISTKSVQNDTKNETGSISETRKAQNISSPIETLKESARSSLYVPPISSLIRRLTEGRKIVEQARNVASGHHHHHHHQLVAGEKVEPVESKSYLSHYVPPIPVMGPAFGLNKFLEPESGSISLVPGSNFRGHHVHPSDYRFRASDLKPVDQSNQEKYHLPLNFFH